MRRRGRRKGTSEKEGEEGRKERKGRGMKGIKMEGGMRSR